MLFVEKAYGGVPTLGFSFCRYCFPPQNPGSAAGTTFNGPPVGVGDELADCSGVGFTGGLIAGRRSGIRRSRKLPAVSCTQ